MDVSELYEQSNLINLGKEGIDVRHEQLEQSNSVKSGNRKMDTRRGQL